MKSPVPWWSGIRNCQVVLSLSSGVTRLWSVSTVCNNVVEQKLFIAISNNAGQYGFDTGHGLSIMFVSTHI